MLVLNKKCMNSVFQVNIRIELHFLLCNYFIKLCVSRGFKGG